MMIKYKYLTILSLFLILTNIQAYSQPDNDLCSGALDLSELIGNDMGVFTQAGPFTNIDATGEPELTEGLAESWFDADSEGLVPSVDQTVWFHFTGDGNTYQFMTLNCPGAAFYSNDTQLALYSGDCDDLSFVGANDDKMGYWSSNWGWFYSFLNFKAELDVEYWLMIDGFNWNDGESFQGIAQGTFCISSVQLEPLTNHNTCTDALAVDEILSATVGNPAFVGPFDNTELGSNIVPDENAETIGISCWEDGPTENGSVWFSFTGNGNPYTIYPTYCSDDDFVYYWGWDSQMAIYTGDCGEMVPVACSEDFDTDETMFWPEIGLDTEEGVTYYVRFDGFNWTDNGYEWTANGGFCLQASAGNVSSTNDILPLDVSFYPNPCYGDITLAWEGDDEVANVVAYDQLGKTVGVYLNVRRGQSINLDVSSGIYILNIKSDNHTGSVTVDVLSE